MHLRRDPRFFRDRKFWFHCSCIVDYIGHAAPWLKNLLHRHVIEFLGGVEIEIELVGFDSGLKRVVEVICETGLIQVPEVVKVLFEFGEAGFPVAGVATGECVERVDSVGREVRGMRGWWGEVIGDLKCWCLWELGLVGDYIIGLRKRILDDPDRRQQESP